MMLLEIAIGDAYGAGMEYVDPAVVRERNDLTRYYQHQLYKSLPAGSYTDDTQMTLAIVEQMLDDSPEADWNALQLSQRFCDVFVRDPRKGYSKGLQALLEEVTGTPDPRCNPGAELLERISEYGYSTKNGAAMRACPLGFEPDLSRAMVLSLKQAAVTHWGSAISAAVGVTAAAHGLIYNLTPPEDLPQWMLDCFSWEEHEMMAEEWPEDRPVTGDATEHLGFDTLRAAVWAVARSETLSDVLRRSVAYTGDVDTVAAVAMGIASERLENDLPNQLYEWLENGRYGRSYLAKLDVRLRARFHAP